MEGFKKEKYVKALDFISKNIGKVEKIEPADKGLTNTNFIVFLEGKTKLFLKILNETIDKSNRLQEIEINKVLSSEGLSPKILHYDIDSYYVFEYMEGRNLVEEDFEDEAIVTSVVNILKYVHALEINNTNTLDIIKANEYYLDGAIEVDFLAEVKEISYKLFKNLDNCLYKNALCHSDINLDNFILASGKVYIIDFEFSGKFDVLFDLVALKNILGDEIFTKIKSLYFGTINNEEEINKKINYFHLLLLVTSINWYLFMANLEEDKEKYISLAKNDFLKLKNVYKEFSF